MDKTTQVKFCFEQLNGSTEKIRFQRGISLLTQNAVVDDGGFPIGVLLPGAKTLCSIGNFAVVDVVTIYNDSGEIVWQK